MSIPGKLSQLLRELEGIDDEILRSDLLIEYAERFKGVPSSIATRPYPAEHKVPACESEAYVFTESSDNGNLNFYFAVENPQGISAKAMAVIIDDTISGESLENINSIEDDIVNIIFGRAITMGKGIGLRSMIGVVKGLANSELNK